PLLVLRRREKPPMRCLHCRKRIGIFRRWVDRQFCCADHRRKARQAYSARLARDLTHDDTFEDGWIVTLNAPQKPKPAGFGAGSGILLVAAALVLVLFLPGQHGAPVADAVPNYLPPVRGWGDRISQMMPGAGKLSLREDFHVDL